MEYKEIRLSPIGIVRVSEKDEEVKIAREGVSGIIEVFEDYTDGLKGIEGFSHLIIMAYLDRVSEEERKTLMVKPRRCIRLGLDPEKVPTVGVFCTDSPHRPNPIALSIVHLLKVDGRELHVSGLDLFDGTPVLDIKPYTESRVFNDLNYPKWYSEILRAIKEKVGSAVEP
ncbi:MAG: tRNA (N6-threonylcarbamoyladenosine(37)-N6)-methyltransferase TrmO [Candidatus Methanomethyliaceae archaeon]|nr:tRNA (N6-threonylcarbamoyladenosine(37)-N6)-methyltransferase TrmO [Candidatus Methanomethyliaceae archaeon]